MRGEELYEVINEALLFALSNLHTSVVCKITGVGEKTISCKPVINRVVNDESKQLPEFIEVPPIFMKGGSSYTAHPITVGDYCLLIISERCYDAWYYGSDFVSPLEIRLHDYSDGFALVGIANESGAITIPSVITQIGDMFAHGDWTHTGNTIHNGNLTQGGDQDITGNVTISNQLEAAISILGNAQFTSIQSSGQVGVSGTFTSADNKTITVTNGIITGIV